MNTEVPACYFHNWWLSHVEGPQWNPQIFWECLKCDLRTIRRSSARPQNYPHIPPCDRITENIAALINLRDNLAITKRCLVNAQIIARSIWCHLRLERQTQQNLADMPEPEILYLIDMLVTAKCDVTRKRCLETGRDTLFVVRPLDYKEEPPWTLETSQS